MYGKYEMEENIYIFQCILQKYCISLRNVVFCERTQSTEIYITIHMAQKTIINNDFC